MILPKFACLKSVILSRGMGVSYWHLVGREGQDAVKHPTMHGTGPTTENGPAPDASSAHVKNSFLNTFILKGNFTLLS